MTPRGIAAVGSATAASAPTTTAQATSTPVAPSRPPSAAATVPTASSAAKPAGSAEGAARPPPQGGRRDASRCHTEVRVPRGPADVSRCLLPVILEAISIPERPNVVNLDNSLTPRSPGLTPHLRPSGEVPPSVKYAMINQLPDELAGDVARGSELPETFGYTLKRKLLGPPLVNEQMGDQKLSRTIGLGVLSPDGISSAAYGTEEMLIAMLPVVGIAAFTIIVPMTLVILAGVALVVLSYREVVSVYTKAGGSYVVARENFGPRVAQVAAVALLIDYTVTVAVQVAAGAAAVVSAFPQLANVPVIGSNILIFISVLAIVFMCVGNLRGIREAGRIFALPTYLFAASVIAMIVAGIVRELAGGLAHAHTGPGTVSIGSHSGLIAFGAIYIMARAFANGGSSLTGIEAVSNAVS